jgi:adenylate cyclase
MRKTVLSLFLLLAVVVTQAQTNLDSLYAVWQDETLSDSSRVAAYKEYIEKAFLYSNPDTVIILSQALLTYGKQHKYPTASAEAYRLMGISNVNLSDYPKALDYFQRSLKIFEEIGDKKNTAGAIINIGVIYAKQGDHSKTLNYFQRGLKIMEELGNKFGVATTINNIGVIYKEQGDYPKALDCFQRSLKIQEEIGNKRGCANANSNIGGIYSSHGDYPKVLEYLLRNIKIYEELEDKMGLATSIGGIGSIYGSQGDYPKALDYFQRSLKIFEQIGNKEGMAGSISAIGNIYQQKGDYTKGRDYSRRSLKIQEEIGDKKGIANSLGSIGNSYLEQGNYTKALDYFQRSLKMMEELGNKSGMANCIINIGLIYKEQGSYPKALEYCKKAQSISQEIGAIATEKNACICLYDSYKAMGKGNEALVYMEKIQVIEDSLNTQETTKKLQQMEFAKQMFADSIAQVEEKRIVKEAHKEEVRQKDKTRNIALGAGGFFILVASGFYRRWRYVKKSKAIVEKEKERSNNLLLNILPADIAEELKIHGKAEARDFDLVSILFTDFKGFTEQSAKMSATDLVNEINHCFEAFDGLMAKHKVEKIKTIGDSYMGAGGLPIPTDDSVKNTVMAAIEMQSFITKRKAENEAQNKPAFEMRVGIHTGPVVAGIVGIKKFQYDLWGDTVNTASRIENNGEAGKVNISQSTYELLKDDADFVFESRGKIEAKGKGEIEMWFVNKRT